VIVVTGTPRSGTTPVGDALAAAPGAATLYEPLNRHVGDRRVQRYFEVPGAAGFTAQRADELIRDVRTLRLRLRPGVFPDDTGFRRLAKHVTGSRTRMTYRRCRLDPTLRTIVWKDPFAAFLAEDLAARHDIPVVVTVRSPRAVAASFKRLSWRFDVAELVTRLGVDGERYAGLLEGLDLTHPVHNAAVLWHVINDHLLRVHARVAGTHLIDLDRIVEDRLAVLHQLYERLGLAWTEAVARRLAHSGRGRGPARPATDRAHVGSRDVAAVNRYWIELLDQEEVRLVDRLNADLWEQLRGRS
jgi:hypothetical protein